MANVALFTAHSPLTGGGGAILRSLIPEFVRHSVTWYYTNPVGIERPNSVYLGTGCLGGSILNDVKDCWLLLSRRNTSRIDQIVSDLLEIECDCYWIVSHNEGLRIAYELSMRQSKRLVHLTVHDDWPAALCGRSLRYRWFAYWADQLTRLTVCSVGTFDVISSGMQSRYQQRYSRRGIVCHRYLSESSIGVDRGRPNIEFPSEVIIGHIGSIYEPNDLWNFVKVLKSYGHREKITIKLRMWGCHLKASDVPNELKEIIDFRPPLPEHEIIPMLSLCDCVYASYSLAGNMRVFSQTSLPTKLTTYLQAGRPIIAHGPQDSSLADFIDRTELGLVWVNRSLEEGDYVLRSVLKLDVPRHNFESARQFYFGVGNIEALDKIFSSAFTAQ